MKTIVLATIVVQISRYSIKPDACYEKTSELSLILRYLLYYFSSIAGRPPPFRPSRFLWVAMGEHDASGADFLLSYFLFPSFWVRKAFIAEVVLRL